MLLILGLVNLDYSNRVVKHYNITVIAKKTPEETITIQ